MVLVNNLKSGYTLCLSSPTLFLYVFNNLKLHFEIKEYLRLKS